MKTIQFEASSKQRLFFDHLLNPERRESIIGYGGARGGGKSFASAMGSVLYCLKYPNATGLLLRRGRSEVVRNYRNEIKKCLMILGLKKHARFYVTSSSYVFRNGSEILLGYIDKESDYERYQGLEFDFIGLEEATQHEAYNWDNVSGSLRSKHGYPTRRWITTNPGGVGSYWVKERFVNAATRWPGHKWIKSTIFDCPATLINTPTYISDTLASLPQWRKRQWLYGDWDALVGAFFDFDMKKLVQDVQIPKYAEWYGGVDWGYAAPYCVVFGATWKEYVKVPGVEGFVTKDRIHVFEELYAKGLSLDEQAMQVQEKEHEISKLIPNFRPDDVCYYADWSVDARMEGESHTVGRTKASVWRDNGFDVLAAKRHSRVSGWELLRRLYKLGVMTISPKCQSLLNEMQAAVYDRPDATDDEDMAKNCQDHALDSLRNMCVMIYGLDYTAPEPERPFRTGLPWLEGIEDDEIRV